MSPRRQTGSARRARKSRNAPASGYRHAVFEHRQPIDADAEGKALPLIGVEPARRQYMAIDHAATQQFHPGMPRRIAAATDHAAAIDPGIAGIDLDRRLGEWEIAGAQAQDDVLTLEKRLEKGFQRPFQMAEMDALVDHQTFDLVEHRRVRGVAVRAIDPPRRDNPQWRALGQHRADLHRRSVRAQQHRPPGIVAIGEIERVVHRPRRVRFRHVERGEIVPVVLDFRPAGDGKAHIGENFGQFVHHLADRMDRSARALRRGQSQVDAFGGEARVEQSRFEFGLARGQCGGHAFACGMDARPFDLALVGGHAAQRFQQGRNPALFAQGGDAQGLDRIGGIGCGDGRQCLIKLFHCRFR